MVVEMMSECQIFQEVTILWCINISPEMLIRERIVFDCGRHCRNVSQLNCGYHIKCVGHKVILRMSLVVKEAILVHPGKGTGLCHFTHVA